MKLHITAEISVAALRECCLNARLEVSTAVWVRVSFFGWFDASSLGTQSLMFREHIVFMFKGLENREEYVRKINVVFSFWRNFDTHTHTHICCYR